jgi:ABC-type Mn2+/Zn2+ transport system ATPase subunit
MSGVAIDRGAVTRTGETARSSDTLLRATQLSVGFGRRAILPPIDFDVRRGEIVGVIGRNGAGKTTLFRTLLGLHPALGGSIERPVTTVVGYVPQRHSVDSLVPSRAADLIAEGTEQGLSFLRVFKSKEAKDRVARAIEATGSAPFLRQRYGNLSEGQKQRVLLARAIAGGADLLVLDEPTSAMDLVAEQEVVEILVQLQQRLAIGILLVSHHLGVLVSMVDRLLFLDADDAFVVSGTAAEVTSHPAFIERYGAVLKPREAAPHPSDVVGKRA